MTPSNQHSAEAIAAYPDSEFGGRFARKVQENRTAFDRGRTDALAVRTHTDQERLARLLAKHNPYEERSWEGMSGTLNLDYRVFADAILADPGVRLVGAREEVARAMFDGEREGFWLTMPDCLQLADALLASGKIADASRVIPDELELAASELQFIRVARMNDRSPQWWAGHDEAEQAITARAARIRSGKAEA